MLVHPPPFRDVLACLGPFVRHLSQKVASCAGRQEQPIAESPPLQPIPSRLKTERSWQPTPTAQSASAAQRADDDRGRPSRRPRLLRPAVGEDAAHGRARGTRNALHQRARRRRQLRPVACAERRIGRLSHALDTSIAPSPPK
eukprot:618405-Pleurochrysis_carterae.AAC.2